MNRRRLELWVTLALYIAAIVSLIVLFARRFSPEGSPLRRTAETVAEYLGELGAVASGTIILIILLVIGGTVTMALLTKGYELYQEMRGRNEQLRAEGRAEGRVAGRAEARAEIIERLRNKGIDVEDLLPADEPDAEPPATP